MFDDSRPRYIGIHPSLCASLKEDRKSLRRRSEAAQPRTSLFDSRLSVLQSRDHPFIPSPLSFASTTILDTCSRRGSTRLVGRDCEWRKSWEMWVSRSCYPIPGELLFNGALFMKLDVARPRMYLPMCEWDRGARLTRRSWMISSGCCSKERAVSMKISTRYRVAKKRNQSCLNPFR